MGSDCAGSAAVALRSLALQHRSIDARCAVPQSEKESLCESSTARKACSRTRARTPSSTRRSALHAPSPARIYAIGIPLSPFLLWYVPLSSPYTVRTSLHSVSSSRLSGESSGTWASSSAHDADVKKAFVRLYSGREARSAGDSCVQVEGTRNLRARGSSVSDEGFGGTAGPGRQRRTPPRGS